MTICTYFSKMNNTISNNLFKRKINRLPLKLMTNIMLNMQKRSDINKKKKQKDKDIEYDEISKD